MVTDVPGATCFNTQPPEGGWFSTNDITSVKTSFNTQPPEGGWRLSGADAV